MPLLKKPATYIAVVVLLILAYFFLATPMGQAVLGLTNTKIDADTINGKTFSQLLNENKMLNATTLIGHDGLYYLQAEHLVGIIANEHYSAYADLIEEGEIEPDATILTDKNLPISHGSIPPAASEKIAANTAARHTAASVVDSATIDLTISGQQISGSVIQSGLKTSFFTNDAGFVSNLAGFTTTNLSEGVNLYYTQSRFDSAFNSKSSDDLAEGASNLFSQWNAVAGGITYGDSIGVGAASTPGATLDVTGTLNASGVVTLSHYATNGGVLYTNGSGVISQTAAGTGGECLQSAGGGSPIWGSCGSGGITGSGANGQIAFFTGTSSQSSESNLFWDATNNRLGIGNAAPDYAIDATGDIAASGSLRLNGYAVFSAPNDNVYLGRTAVVSGVYQRVAIGAGALAWQRANSESSYYNIAIGPNALSNNRGGDRNIAIGYVSQTTGPDASYNTSVGHYALQWASGNNNTALGYAAGNLTTGNGGVFIGFRAGEAETGSNKLYISNTGTTTPLIYGDFGTPMLRINGSFETTGVTTLSNYTTNGGILYTNGSGVVGQTAAGTATECLKSAGGGSPTWGSCGGGGGATAWSDLTEPSGNLSLSMSTNTTALTWATGTSTNNLFSLTSANSANGTGALLNVQTGTTSTVMPLRIRAGATEALAVRANGNVGIGTITPANSLHVVGTTQLVSSAGDPLILKSSGATGNGGVADDGWNYIQFYDAESDRQGYFGIDNAGNFEFMPEVAGAFVQIPDANLTVEAGRLGLGLDAPLAKLNIRLASAPVSTAITNSYIHLGEEESGVSSYRLITFGYADDTTNNAPVYMGYLTTSTTDFEKGALVFGTRDVTTDTAPTERMRINPNGTVNFSNDIIAAGALNWTGSSAPALSGAGSAKTYFDSTANTIKLSENGGSYADILTSGRSIQSPLSTKTGNYGLTKQDSIILLDTSGGTFAVTLPSAVGITGREYTVKQMTGSNFGTVVTTGAETIEGAANFTFNSQYQTIRVVSNGSHWLIIGQN